MKWFAEARFGLFIHWGVYSVPAGEWKGKTNYGEWFMEETHMPVSQYEKFAKQFNPVKFDARQWVALAKEAGMKYIVITSKHHDGFGMFPSQETDWCIKSTPFQRDPLKELSAACREAGIKFCLYHSIMDWHHPDWGKRRAWNDKASGKPDMDRYTAYMKRQLKELVSNYGPLGILWFDGEWEDPWTHDRGVDLEAYCRGLQPDIIINNRVGKARAGMEGMDKGKGLGDYGTPEQNVPANGFGPGVYWESCMTMNDHWGYNKHDDHWKSAAELIHILVDCSSKGGNYLLNVGPTSEGLFPGPSIERLKAIGAVDEGQRREHLRHDGQLDRQPEVGTVDHQGRHNLSARLRLAEGRQARGREAGQAGEEGLAVVGHREKAVGHGGWGPGSCDRRSGQGPRRRGYGDRAGVNLECGTSVPLSIWSLSCRGFPAPGMMKIIAYGGPDVVYWSSQRRDERKVPSVWGGGFVRFPTSIFGAVR